MFSSRYYALLVVGLILIGNTGCVNIGYVKKLNSVGRNEVMVFGKLKVICDGKEVKTVGLSSNKAGKKGWNGAIQALSVDGIISSRLPVGDSYLYYLINGDHYIKDYRYQFKPDEATLHLPQAGTCYYVGDIVVDWTPIKSRDGKTGAFIMSSLLYGPIGGAFTVASMPYVGGTALIMVRDNLAEDQKLFQERFHTDKTLVPALLQLGNAQKNEATSPPTPKQSMPASGG